MKRIFLALGLLTVLFTPCYAQTLAPLDIPPIDLTSSGRGGVSGVLPQVNGGSGVNTSSATNGQLLIGKTSDHSLNLSTLTAGSNVTIVNGAGTVTVSAANTFVPTVNVQTAATVTAAVDNAYLCDTTANAIAVTLPTAVGHSGHQVVVFLQVLGGSNHVTFATTSAQTVNGAAASGLGLTSANKSYTFMSDGANWVIVSQI